MILSWRAWRLFRRAQKFHALGAYGKAAALYRQTLALQPDDMGALLWLGLAESERGRFAEARVRIERAISIEPEAGAARLFLARVAYDEGRTDEARTILAELLRKSENAQAQALLALCALGVGDLDEVRRLLPRRIPCVPWLLARFAVAIEERAGAPHEEQRPVLPLRQAIARGAASAENYYALGLAALRSGRPALARRAFERCADPQFVQERLAEIAGAGGGASGV